MSVGSVASVGSEGVPRPIRPETELFERRCAGRTGAAALSSTVMGECFGGGSKCGDWFVARMQYPFKCIVVRVPFFCEVDGGQRCVRRPRRSGNSRRTGMRPSSTDRAATHTREGSSEKSVDTKAASRAPTGKVPRMCRCASASVADSASTTLECSESNRGSPEQAQSASMSVWSSLDVGGGAHRRLLRQSCG